MLHLYNKRYQQQSIQIGKIQLILKIAKHNLIQIRKESTQLRTNYLIQRASEMDIENNKTVRNTTRNINKIEQIIKLWKVIQFTTNKKSNSSIQTIDVPTDTSIP